MREEKTGGPERREDEKRQRRTMRGRGAVLAATIWER